MFFVSMETGAAVANSVVSNASAQTAILFMIYKIGLFLRKNNGLMRYLQLLHYFITCIDMKTCVFDISCKKLDI